MANPSHLVGLIPEHPSKHGGRLGRHVHFDDRSWNYRVPLRKGAVIQTRTWERTVKPFNQGDLGSCTGNGAVGVVCVVTGGLVVVVPVGEGRHCPEPAGSRIVPGPQSVVPVVPLPVELFGR